MKKFLSLFLALILVVGLLVPAVSAEPAETETKSIGNLDRRYESDQQWHR